MQATGVSKAIPSQRWPKPDYKSTVLQEFSQFYPGQAVTKDVFLRILREVDPSLTASAVEACICAAKLSEHDLIDFTAFFSWLFSPAGESFSSAHDELLRQLCQQSREDEAALSFGSQDAPEVDDALEPEEQRRQIFRICCSGRSLALNAMQACTALAACGLYPPPDDVALRSGVDGMEEEQFVSFVDDLQRAGCATGPSVLPVALRGVSLRQVQDLLATFIDSGWLAAQCEARGEATAHEGGCQPCHEDTHTLNDLVVRPLTSSDPQVRQHIPEEWQPSLGEGPQRDCSYAELVNPSGLGPQIFISHSWGQSFSKTVGALTASSNQLQSWAGVPEAEELVVWMSVFGLNQHDGADAGCSADSPAFRAAMEHASCGVAMVIDEDMRVFSRLWCLYEAYEANALEKDFELVLDPAFEAEGGSHIRTLVDQLHLLSGFHALTGCVEDKTAIWMAVANARNGGSPGPKVVEHNELDLSYCLSALSVFDVQVCQILSSPLLRRSLRLFDGTSALRCISLGADCGRDELMAAATMDADLSMVLHPRFAREGCDLAHVLSYFGRGDALSFVFKECGASACIAAPDGSTPLHWAAVEGQLEASAMLLAHGALVSAADWEGKTPLLSAVEGGHRGVASLLLERLASPNEEDSCGMSALHLAASDGHVDMVSLLIQRNASVQSVAMGWTPLHHAAFQGHCDVSNLLLAARADPDLADEDGLMPLHFSADSGHLEVATALLKGGAAPDIADGEGKRPLHKAALSGHEKIVTLLMKNGASVHALDTRQEGPLHKAAFAGHSHIVELLLSFKAHVGDRNSVGWTPLHRAVGGCHVETVEVLLHHSAAVATCDIRHKTPLHKAAFLGSFEIVRMLLEHHASVDEQDVRGETPLHKAAFAGHSDIILMLLDYGATATAESNHGWTPLHRCAGAGHLDATEILVLAEWMALSVADFHGDTPWMRAQFFGHGDVLNLLLSFAETHP